MTAIGLASPASRIVRSMDEARAVLHEMGLPLIIRPSFTLGGTGGGIAYNAAEFERVVAGGLAASPTGQVLIEESVLGWKEFEMEVVRDSADNCIIVCSIENVDPMGVHTGNSITVAPALTLTDKEYQIMRNASIAVLREIGVDTGGSNVQFAINPDDGRMVVIEMNPRVSRSSALASKATGFPIAKVAAKLAVGYHLDELKNDITGSTPASFEPTIDYVVVKVPRFTFEKFPGAEPILTTSMKSVGEAMAIGRCFSEALQKGLRSMETGLTGLNEALVGSSAGQVLAALAQPRPDRVLVIAEAFRRGIGIEQVYAACRYDRWFLEQIEQLVAIEAEVRSRGLPSDEAGLQRLKSLGFSDPRLAALSGKTAAEVALRRRLLGVAPVYKRVDTCAAEFPTQTSYMYSTYDSEPGFAGECEAWPSDRAKVVILGGGPNRIGQGIEFDYCCVHAAYALKEAGFEAIMVNCNPETVSTDYDTSDRLYFEPLTAEDVIELIRAEQRNGTVAGRDRPVRRPDAVEVGAGDRGGADPDPRRLARRHRSRRGSPSGSRRCCTGWGCGSRPTVRLSRWRRPSGWRALIGFPLVVRPSYVLGGRAMDILYEPDDLRSVLRPPDPGGPGRHRPGGEVLPGTRRSCSTATSRMPSRSVSTRSPTARTSTSPASCSTSRRRACTRANPACSLPPHTLSGAMIAEIERQGGRTGAGRSRWWAS